MDVECVLLDRESFAASILGAIWLLKLYVSRNYFVTLLQHTGQNWKMDSLGTQWIYFEKYTVAVVAYLFFKRWATSTSPKLRDGEKDW